MRAQASAVYIGIITIVASTGPVIVPALLDWVSTFYRCSSGLKYALLVVVPSFYLLSSFLFMLLGIVTVQWERRQRNEGQYDILEPHRDDNTTSCDNTTDNNVKPVS